MLREGYKQSNFPGITGHVPNGKVDFVGLVEQDIRKDDLCRKDLS